MQFSAIYVGDTSALKYRLFIGPYIQPPRVKADAPSRVFPNEAGLLVHNVAGAAEGDVSVCDVQDGVVRRERAGDSVAMQIQGEGFAPVYLERLVSLYVLYQVDPLVILDCIECSLQVVVRPFYGTVTIPYVRNLCTGRIRLLASPQKRRSERHRNRRQNQEGLTRNRFRVHCKHPFTPFAMAHKRPIVSPTRAGAHIQSRS